MPTPFASSGGGSSAKVSLENDVALSNPNDEIVYNDFMVSDVTTQSGDDVWRLRLNNFPSSYTALQVFKSQNSSLMTHLEGTEVKIAARNGPPAIVVKRPQWTPPFGPFYNAVNINGEVRLNEGGMCDKYFDFRKGINLGGSYPVDDGEEMFPSVTFHAWLATTMKEVSNNDEFYFHHGTTEDDYAIRFARPNSWLTTTGINDTYVNAKNSVNLQINTSNKLEVTSTAVKCKVDLEVDGNCTLGGSFVMHYGADEADYGIRFARPGSWGPTYQPGFSETYLNAIYGVNLQINNTNKVEIDNTTFKTLVDMECDENLTVEGNCTLGGSAINTTTPTEVKYNGMVASTTELKNISGTNYNAWYLYHAAGGFNNARYSICSMRDPNGNIGHDRLWLNADEEIKLRIGNNQKLVIESNTIDLFTDTHCHEDLTVDGNCTLGGSTPDFTANTPLISYNGFMESRCTHTGYNNWYLYPKHANGFSNSKYAFHVQTNANEGSYRTFLNAVNSNYLAINNVVKFHVSNTTCKTYVGMQCDEDLTVDGNCTLGGSAPDSTANTPVISYNGFMKSKLILHSNNQGNPTNNNNWYLYHGTFSDTKYGLRFERPHSWTSAVIGVKYTSINATHGVLCKVNNGQKLQVFNTNVKSLVDFTVHNSDLTVDGNCTLGGSTSVVNGPKVIYNGFLTSQVLDPSNGTNQEWCLYQGSSYSNANHFLRTSTHSLGHKNFNVNSFSQVALTINNIWILRVVWNKCYINKNTSVTGNITATGNITPGSDDRIKWNETPITNALETIRKLKPQTYDKSMSIPEDGQQPADTFREAGLIAQEVLEVPELAQFVKPDGTKTEEVPPTEEEQTALDEARRALDEQREVQRALEKQLARLREASDQETIVSLKTRLPTEQAKTAELQARYDAAVEEGGETDDALKALNAQKKVQEETETQLAQLREAEETNETAIAELELRLLGEQAKTAELDAVFKQAAAAARHPDREVITPFHLDYNSIFTHMIAAMKELDATVQAQAARIAALEAR